MYYMCNTISKRKMHLINYVDTGNGQRFRETNTGVTR